MQQGLCKELGKAANDQSKLIASIAGTVQGAMTKNEEDLQSMFKQTHANLQAIIQEAEEQINADYQEKEIFAK